MTLTPHACPKQPSKTSEPSFVSANSTAIDLSPTTSGCPSVSARLKLLPKLDVCRATAGLVDVHPTATMVPSTRPPSHFPELPEPDRRRVRGERVRAERGARVRCIGVSGRAFIAVTR